MSDLLVKAVYSMTASVSELQRTIWLLLGMLVLAEIQIGILAYILWTKGIL